MAIDRIRVNEHSSRTVTFTLLDQAGVAVPLTDINLAALTLYDMESYVPGGSPVAGILNARDAQNILNAHNVTIHATSGLITWAMQPDDNGDPDGLTAKQLIDRHRRQIWRHRAEFRFVCGTVELDYQCEIEVVNLRKAA